jgi:hypothetical protein
LPLNRIYNIYNNQSIVVVKMQQVSDPESLNKEIRRAEAIVEGLEGDIEHETTLLGLQKQRIESLSSLVLISQIAIATLNRKTDDDTQAKIRDMAASMEDSRRQWSEAIKATEDTRDRSLVFAGKLDSSRTSLEEARKQRDRLAASSGMSAASDASARPSAAGQAAERSREHPISCFILLADLSVGDSWNRV